jgi:hypothetical protein
VHFVTKVNFYFLNLRWILRFLIYDMGSVKFFLLGTFPEAINDLKILFSPFSGIFTLNLIYYKILKIVFRLRYDFCVVEKVLLRLTVIFCIDRRLIQYKAVYNIADKKQFFHTCIFCCDYIVLRKKKMANNGTQKLSSFL